ncbi:hypothetical protein [Nevskia sp.]|uniref:hypothetical protein n=1 Tax=Nevskia sp. TaxID=1929292 RepID=UPI003F72EA87
MNHREQAINQDLQILADAYRLGHIQRPEYRARRRQVLAGWQAIGDQPAAASVVLPDVSAVALQAADRHREPPPLVSAPSASGARGYRYGIAVVLLALLLVAGLAFAGATPPLPVLAF